MRIDYTKYPFIDNYKNVRYITESLIKCMKKCFDKIREFGFNIDSCEVCYIYKGMFIACKFNSVDGWLQTANIKCSLGNNTAYDFDFDVNTWREKLSEKEQVILCISTYLTFFIENAQVETIHVNKKSGTSHLNVSYQNATNRNVKIYDSTWLRTIVMSDSFGVRGHFRWQPIGEGRKERKLIWVSDFEKSGYTRTAGKIRDNQ